MYDILEYVDEKIHEIPWTRLFILFILTAGLILAIYLSIKISKWIFRKLHGHCGKVALVTGGIAVLCIGIGGYAFVTMNLQQPKDAVDVHDARFYIEDGLFHNTHYMQYVLSPTDLTQAGVVYQVEVSNGMISRQNKISWSELELSIGKGVLIKNKISEDEYSALGINPNYTSSVYSITNSHNISYLILPVVYFFILILVAIYRNRDGYKKAEVLYAVR